MVHHQQPVFVFLLSSIIYNRITKNYSIFYVGLNEKDLQGSFFLEEGKDGMENQGY